MKRCEDCAFSFLAAEYEPCLSCKDHCNFESKPCNNCEENCEKCRETDAEKAENKSV